MHPCSMLSLTEQKQVRYSGHEEDPLAAAKTRIAHIRSELRITVHAFDVWMDLQFVFATIYRRSTGLAENEATT